MIDDRSTSRDQLLGLEKPIEMLEQNSVVDEDLMQQKCSSKIKSNPGIIKKPTSASMYVVDKLEVIFCR